MRETTTLTAGFVALLALSPWTRHAQAQADPAAQQAEPSAEVEAADARAQTDGQATPGGEASSASDVAGEAEADGTALDAVDGQGVTGAPVAGLSAESGPSQGELDAFLTDSALDEATAAGPSLRVYGFSDFSVSHQFDKTAAQEASRGPGTNFYVGNLNVYLDADLTHGVRSLSEIRFLYLPNGGPAGQDAGSVGRFNATTYDYADSSRPFKWGGIEIERAWIEYQAHNLFAIRAGQYLTPYGIWNVDHGSPVIIPTTRPYVVGEALFPERQTGFQVYGTYMKGIATLGYHVTLSNGRGNINEWADLDGNKAVGGRLYLKLDGAFGQLSLGLSGYTGRRTDADIGFQGASLGRDLLVQWDEFSYAGDLLWRWRGLHFQFEGIANDIRFTDEGRYVPVFGAPGNARLADARRWGLYALLGYRTPWLGLMPYFMVSVYSPGAPTPVDVGPSFFDSVEYVVGLNMRPIAALALKLQYGALVNDKQVNLDFLEVPDVRHEITGQIAWSF